MAQPPGAAHSSMAGSDPKRVKDMLSIALERQHHVSPFSVTIQDSIQSRPRLSLEGIGYVALPLSQRDSRAIRDEISNNFMTTSTSPLPQEQHLGTSINIPGASFSLANQTWFIQATTAASRLFRALGINLEAHNVSMRLSHLAVHFEGFSSGNTSMFEFGPEVFGHAMVILPTGYEGGEIEIKFEDHIQTYNPTVHSKTQTCHIAWLKCAELSFRPVFSGTRIMLVYNLIQTDRRQLLSTVSIDPLERLQHALQAWKRALQQRMIHNTEFPSPLVWKLTVSPRDMAPQHKAFIDLIQTACRKEGICYFFGRLEQEVKGRFRVVEPNMVLGQFSREIHPHTEILEIMYFATFIEDPKAGMLTSKMTILPECVIQGRPFKGQTPSHETVQHSNSTSTHYWSANAIVLLPANERNNFLIQTVLSRDARKKLDDLLEAHQEYRSSEFIPIEMANSDFLELCEIIVSKALPGPKQSSFLKEYVSPYTLCQLAAAMMRIDRLDLCDSMLTIMTVFSQVLLDTMGRAIAHYGWATIEPRFSTIMNRLTTFAGKMSAFTTFRAAVSSFTPMASNEASIVERWAAEHFPIMLARQQSVTKNDGHAMASAAIMFGLPMLEKAVSILSQKSPDVKEVMTFEICLLQHAEDSWISPTDMSATLEQLAPVVIPKLKLIRLTDAFIVLRPRSHPTDSDVEALVKSSDLILLVEGHLKYTSIEVFGRFLDSLIQQTKTLGRRLLCGLVMPIVDVLVVSERPAHLQPWSTKDKINFMKMILAIYIRVMSATCLTKTEVNFQGSSWVNTHLRRGKELAELLGTDELEALVRSNTPQPIVPRKRAHDDDE